MGAGGKNLICYIVYLAFAKFTKMHFFIVFLAELNFAIETQGYRLLDVYEVQFYPRYDLTLFQNF